MKLFTKYNRVNLLTSTLLFVFSGIAFYYFIKFIVIDEVDEGLKIERREITAYVKQHDRLPVIIPVRDLNIQYTLADEPYTKIYFRTFYGFDSLRNKKSGFRELIFGIKAAGNEYKISVIKSMEVANDLLRSILLISFSAILLMLAVFYIINRIVLKRLWKPFYDTLSRLKVFSLGQNEPLRFPSANVEEFDLMNKTLEITTGKAQQDYLALKEFTENASHELQTPLAIIQSKLDLLIQEEHLSETQSRIVQSVYESVQKLSRLNQSLLLLAKIGNHQFEEAATIDFRKKTEQKVMAFQELWATEDITVNVSLQEAAVKMNVALADILLNNLISNATKHNFKGGTIDLILTETGLTIRNTGTTAALDANRLFTKFYTASNGAGHNGLGLSIVKQICDTSGFTIGYSYKNQLHSFTIIWQPV